MVGSWQGRLESPSRPSVMSQQNVCLSAPDPHSLPSLCIIASSTLHVPFFVYSGNFLINLYSSFTPPSGAIHQFLLAPCQDVFLWLETSQQGGYEKSSATMYEYRHSRISEYMLTKSSATSPPLLDPSPNIETSLSIGLSRPPFSHSGARHSPSQTWLCDRNINSERRRWPTSWLQHQ